MARKTRETTVGGFDVRVTPHGARAAQRLLAKVGRFVAPAFAKLKAESLGVKLDGLDPNDIDLRDVNLEGLVPAIEAFFGSLSDDAIDAMTAELLEHTTIVLPDEDGKLKNYDLAKGEAIDDAFTGRLSLMWRVMAAVLEVNYGPFSAVNGWLAAAARAASGRLQPSNSAAS